MQASPHLNFKGNCLEAFKQYAEILGGRIVFSMTYGETPMGGQVAQDQRNRIAHARLEFGGRAIIGADPPAEHYRQPTGFSLMVESEDPAEAERVFSALARGGTITMPFGETFWARRFGACVDRFGIPWMVNCGKPLDSLHSRGT